MKKSECCNSEIEDSIDCFCGLTKYICSKCGNYGHYNSDGKGW